MIRSTDVECHRVTAVGVITVAGRANAAGRIADAIIEGVGAGLSSKDDHPAGDWRSSGLHQHLIFDDREVVTAVRIMALNAQQAEVSLCAAGKIAIAMGRNDRRRRCAGAVMAGITKIVILGWGVEQVRAVASMCPVAGAAFIGRGCVVAMRAVIGTYHPHWQQRQ